MMWEKKHGTENIVVPVQQMRALSRLPRSMKKTLFIINRKRLTYGKVPTYVFTVASSME